MIVRTKEPLHLGINGIGQTCNQEADSSSHEQKFVPANPAGESCKRIIDEAYESLRR
jgi:hypothetical protein